MRTANVGKLGYRSGRTAAGWGNLCKAGLTECSKHGIFIWSYENDTDNGKDNEESSENDCGDDIY